MIKFKHYKHIYYNSKDEYGPGFFVRVRLPGIDKSKKFVYKDYGGKRKALKAAILWRNEQWKEVGITSHRFGLPEVNRIKTKGEDRSITYSWRCRWREFDNGKRYSRSFAELKYGEVEAKQRAEKHALYVFKKFYNYNDNAEKL